MKLTRHENGNPRNVVRVTQLPLHIEALSDRSESNGYLLARDRELAELPFYTL